MAEKVVKTGGEYGRKFSAHDVTIKHTSSPTSNAQRGGVFSRDPRRPSK